VGFWKRQAGPGAAQHTPEMGLRGGQEGLRGGLLDALQQSKMGVEEIDMKPMNILYSFIMLDDKMALMSEDCIFDFLSLLQYF